MTQILVVDDSSDIRRSAEGFFTEHGYAVITAENGKEGVEKLKANPAIQLIITDILMPIMDGVTMIKTIREELANHEVCILVMSTEYGQELKQQCKPFKLKGWMGKPPDFTRILPFIQKLLKNEH